MNITDGYLYVTNLLKRIILVATNDWTNNDFTDLIKLTEIDKLFLFLHYKIN